MCDVLLNVAFNFMRDIIFANFSSHEIIVTVKISRYTVLYYCSMLDNNQLELIINEIGILFEIGSNDQRNL